VKIQGNERDRSKIKIKNEGCRNYNEEQNIINENITRGKCRKNYKKTR
jgi:hypothetical protein